MFKRTQCWPRYANCVPTTSNPAGRRACAHNATKPSQCNPRPGIRHQTARQVCGGERCASSRARGAFSTWSRPFGEPPRCTASDHTEGFKPERVSAAILLGAEDVSVTVLFVRAPGGGGTSSTARMLTGPPKIVGRITLRVLGPERHSQPEHRHSHGVQASTCAKSGLLVSCS